MHFAAEGALKVLQHLLEIDSSSQFVNLYDRLGRTALDYAEISQNFEAASLLKSTGAQSGPKSEDISIAPFLKQVEDDQISDRAAPEPTDTTSRTSR